MAIKARLTDEDRDSLTKDVNDLDAVYLQRMQEDGIDPELLAQFRDLSLEFDKDNTDK